MESDTSLLESCILLNSSHEQTEEATTSREHENTKIKLTAETLKVLCSVDVNTLDIKSRFELLFNDIQMLKSTAIQGCLGESRLRALAWMIFLNCVPFEKSKWIEVISSNRKKFESTKDDVISNPRRSGCQLDHPLSQIGSSDWNKHFNQNQTRSLIMQDVIRINQHSDFFGLKTTQDRIVDLLLIFVLSAKKEYKQGMHEILGCIMFVVLEDYTWLAENFNSNDEMKHIAKIEFLDHDTYTIFEAIMSIIYEWYDANSGSNATTSNAYNLNTNGDLPSESGGRLSQAGKNVLSMNPKLFQEETSVDTSIIMRINHINNVVLKNNEYEIFCHMKTHDLSPHLFGIRWLRLLFLRELEFPGVMVLWDAIFAVDNRNFNLVNFIFVSLLSHLRDDLLTNDNSGCLHLLMQQQFNFSPIEVLKLALYFYNPAFVKIYLRPKVIEWTYAVISPSKSFSSPKTASEKTPKKADRPKDGASSSKKQRDEKSHQQSQQNVFKSKIKSDDGVSKTAVDSTFREKLMQTYNIQQFQHNHDFLLHKIMRKVNQMVEENNRSQKRFLEAQELCQYSSLKIGAIILLLQKKMISSDVFKNDNELGRAIIDLVQIKSRIDQEILKIPTGTIFVETKNHHRSKSF